jgi:hypothetical protein
VSTPRRKATYDDLCAIPEQFDAEIVDGELALDEARFDDAGTTTTILVREPARAEPLPACSLVTGAAGERTRFDRRLRRCAVIVNAERVARRAGGIADIARHDGRLRQPKDQFRITITRTRDDEPRSTGRVGDMAIVTRTRSTQCRAVGTRVVGCRSSTPRSQISNGGVTTHVAADGSSVHTGRPVCRIVRARVEDIRDLVAVSR